MKTTVPKLVSQEFDRYYKITSIDNNTILLPISYRKDQNIEIQYI